MQDPLDISEVLSPDFNDRVVESLYASEGTQTLTTMLACALVSSKTITEMNGGPLYTNSLSGTTFSDNAKVTDGVSLTIKALLEGLEITAISGKAENTNFPVDPDTWSAISVIFHYETTIKKVEIDVTLTITEYLSITVQGGQRSVGTTVLGIEIDFGIEFNYALNIYTQTDLELTVLVCTVDPDDKGKEQEKEDISIEIGAIISGEGEASTDNIVKQLQDFIEAKNGTYLTLCEVPMCPPISIPVAGETPIFSVNVDIAFVIKFQFAAGISTKISILDAVQVGVKGNTKNKTFSTYRNTLPGSNRFSMDVYACGYLGIKCGVKTSLTVSFYAIRGFGEVGATFEAGIYFDIYGYLHCNLSKTNSYNNKLDFSIQGGLYCEVGLYLEVDLIIESQWFRFEAGVGIIDLKLPLFDLGDKYVLMDIDDVSEKCFINKNVMPVSEMSIFTGKYIDITSGEEVSRPIDSSKISLWFSTPYFRFEPYDSTIRMNPNAIGRYDDGVQKGDKILTTTMSVSYGGSLLSFRDSFIGEIELTWVDESIKIDEANLGKFYTASFVADCDGKIIPLGERTIQVGHAIGDIDTLYLLYHYDINQDYRNHGGWDVEPRFSAMDDQDTVYTLHLHCKQTYVGYIYYGENGWTKEIRTANLGEVPKEPKYAENEYIEDLKFVSWTGYKGYFSRMKDKFFELTEIPFDVFGYSMSFQIPWSEDVGKTVLITSGYADKQSALIDLLQLYEGCYYHKSACYYVAQYNCSQFPVTVITKDYVGETISKTYDVDYGSKIGISYLSTQSKGYNIIGWDADGDGVSDFVEPWDAPVVSGPQTLTGIFEQIKGKVIVLDENKNVLSEHSVPTYSEIFLDKFEEIHTLADTLTEKEEQDETFYFGKTINTTGFEYSHEGVNWYELYSFKYSIWMMEQMYVRPSCAWARNITFNAGDGKFTDGSKTINFTISATSILPVDFTQGPAYIDKQPTKQYKQLGWRNLNDDSFYGMDEEIVLTGHLSLQAVFEESERLYTIEVSCEKSLLPNSNVYRKSICLLSYDEMVIRRQYYIDNSPEKVVVDNRTYLYGKPLVTEDIESNTITIVYLPGTTSAFYTLTFLAGDGIFVGGEKVKKIDSLKAERTLSLSKITLPEYATEDKIYTHTGWKVNDEFIDKDAEYTVTGDMTFNAVYESSDRIYTITFVAGCGYFEPHGLVIELKGRYGETVNAPSAPIDNSFYATYNNVFDGWDKQIPTTFTQDLTINGVWKHTEKTYKITYMLNGELYGEIEQKRYLDSIVERAAPTVPDGKEFSGWKWSTDAIRLNAKPESMPCYNLTVYGEIVTYYVIYSIDGVIEKLPTDIGDEVSIRILPENPVGYSYTDWEIKGVELGDNNSFEMPNCDVTISTSKQVHEHNLTYTIDSEPFGTAEVLAYGQKIELKDVSYKDGYTFGGWYCDGNLLDEENNSMPDNDVELIGNYSINKYTVSYYLNDESEPTYTDTYEYNANVEVRENEAADTFSGWISREFAPNDVSFTMPSRDVIVWGGTVEGTYNISYNVEGIGTFSVKANANETVVLPFGNIPNYQTFIEWNSEDITLQENSFMMPDEDITICGEVLSKHFVYIYDDDNGELLNSFEVNASEVVYLNEYVKRGKVSSAWEQFYGEGIVIDENCFIMPNTDIKLRVLWTDYLTIDDGVNFDKYDTDSPTVYGYTYETEYNWNFENGEYKLLTITESGLTISGSAKDVQILISIKEWAGNVTLSNLSLQMTSDSYFLNYSYDYDFLCDYSMDAALIIDTEFEITVNVDGVVQIENKDSENTQNDSGNAQIVRFAAISARNTSIENMSLEERGTMLSGNTLTFAGVSDDASLEIYSDCNGLFTYNILSISNIGLKITSKETALQGAGINLTDVECAIVLINPANYEVEAINSKSESIGNGITLSFEDCSLNINGTISGSGRIEFLGETYGNVSAIGRSALIVNEGDLCFDLSKGNRISFESENKDNDAELSVFIVLVDQEIVFGDDNGYLTENRLFLHAVKKAVFGFLSDGFNNLGYYQNGEFVSALYTVIGND